MYKSHTLTLSSQPSLPVFRPDGNIFSICTRISTGQVEYIRHFSGSSISETLLLVNNEANAAYAEPGSLLYQRDNALVRPPFDRRRYFLIGEPRTLNDDVLVYTAGGPGCFQFSSGASLVTQTGKGRPFRNVWVYRKCESRRSLSECPGVLQQCASLTDGRKDRH